MLGRVPAGGTSDDTFVASAPVLSRAEGFRLVGGTPRLMAVGQNTCFRSTAISMLGQQKRMLTIHVSIPFLF